MFIEEKNLCEHCRGTGRTFARSQFIEGQYCTSCNGTGIKGNPAKGLLIIVAFLAVFGYIAWQVLVGIYD